MKTRAQLRNELAELRQRITELEASETARKRAEKALKESEEKFRTLAEQSPNMIFINNKGRVVYANKRCEEIMGYKRDEFYAPDFDFLRLIAPESIESVESSSAKHMKGEEVEPYEYTLITKDGKRIEAIIATRLMDYEGERAILGIVTDITERKRADEALKEYSERLEEMAEQRTKALRDAQEQLVRQEKLAVLGQLAGGVGHELRNPLGVISNAVYYLQTILPEADETIKEYLQMISSEVHHSEKVVSNLLDLSRAKPAEREEVTVSDLVAQVLDRHSPPDKVKVTTKIPSDLPPIFVDPRQIEQVLTNLVTNAYQATPEGGRLTIEARAEKGQVCLSITDTGCGISQENMERLFEPLFTTKARGIGLGLAVSKNLVEVNGGSIEVKSEESEGSTFTVILPPKEAQA